jgi:hypothetical protein
MAGLTLAVLTASIAGMAFRHAAAQNISVTGGDVQSNATPTSYDSITVSGTGAGGSPSTYTADAALTLANNLSVSDSGVFNANADVTVTGQSYWMGVDVSNAGVLNLNSGTLSASRLSLNGPNAVNQAGGHYATGSLSLSGTSSLTYGAADSLTGFVGISGASTLTLETNLAGIGSLYLWSGGSIARTTQTIAAYEFLVDDTTLDLLAGDTFSSSSSNTVRFGGVVNAPTGTTLGNVNIFGADASSASATLNINGNTNVSGWTQTGNAGVVNLASGTLSTSYLYLSGTGSLTRGSGHFAVGSGYVGVFNGASLTYAPGDSVTTDVYVSGGGVLTLGRDLALTGHLGISGSSSFVPAGHHYTSNSLTVDSSAAVTYGSGDSVSNSVYVTNAGTLTLAKNLSLAGTLNLENGGSIARTSETIAATYLNVNNASLALLAGDSFDPTGYATVYGGGVLDTVAGSSLGDVYVSGTNAAGASSTLDVNGATTADYVQVSSAGVVNLASGTLSATYLTLYGSGAAVQGGGHYAIGSGYLGVYDGAALTYGPGDSVTTSVYVANGGALTLGQDLALTGHLGIAGPSSFVPAGHHYTVDSLGVDSNAAVTYGPGDSVTGSVWLGTGTLTLDKNLSLAGTLSVANGGTIARTTETIAATYLNVNNASLALLAGDSFDPTGYATVYGGGVLDTVAGSSLGDVYVSGTNTSGASSTLNVNGDTTADYVQVSAAGTLNLASGTFTSDVLALYNAGSATRAGGTYVTDYLGLYAGATLTYGTGDSIGGLAIDGAGSLLDALEALSLTSLSVNNGGLLRLNSFTGTGAVPNWGLRLAGDTVSYVQSLIAGNLLSGGSTPLAVFFDSGSNFTFVTPSSTPIPEIDPAAAGGAWTLLVGTLGILERRKRRVREASGMA